MAKEIDSEVEKSSSSSAPAPDLFQQVMGSPNEAVTRQPKNGSVGNCESAKDANGSVEMPPLFAPSGKSALLSVQRGGEFQGIAFGNSPKPDTDPRTEAKPGASNQK